MEAKPFALETVTDELNQNRLILMYIPSKLDPQGYDFYGIAWDQFVGGSWINKLLIREKDFDNGTHRKFISNIHSIKHNGEAILKIGESDNPRDSRSCTIRYSWRKWDLTNNAQLEYIKSCINPFDNYEDPSS